MGSFTHLRTFISSHILPSHTLLSKDSSVDHSAELIPASTQAVFVHQQHYKLQQQAIDQFPCEDRHSFNPHYQHNLISTSPSYSTPPSLSSSPTNSSPCSTTSNSSASLSRSSFGYSYHQQQQFQRSLHNGTLQSYPSQHQYQSQTQQQQHQYNKTGRTYSYHRQQYRRQNQRNYVNQQHFEHMDDDLLIGYDNQYYGITPSTLPNETSMAHYSPKEASVLTPSSSSSSLNSFPRYGATVSAASAAQAVSETFSSTTAVSFKGHLPSIAESTLSDVTTSVVGKVSPGPVCKENNNNNKPMTAKQSLMRIAQCAPHQDNWCSGQSGQYARHYAETRSRGVTTDGRRARRM